MNRHLAACLILVLAGVLPATRAAAAEAKDPFDYLYGDDAKRVLAGHDPKAITDFAAHLLSDADSVITDPAVKAAVLEKACEFGLMNPTGYATAAAAAQRLIAVAPDRNTEWQEKLLQIYQAQFKATRSDDERVKLGPLLVEQLVLTATLEMAGGQTAKAAENARQALSIVRLAPADRRDVLQMQARQLAARAAALLQADSLKTQLAADPQSKTAAEKLVRLYLVDLDNPEEAAKFADRGADEATRNCILVAGMKTENLPEAALLSLTEWYKALADSASADAKTAMLRRAKSYGEQYLKVHTEEDLQRLKVATLTGRVSEDLIAATTPTAPAVTPTVKTPVKTPTAPARATGPIKFPLRINCGGQDFTDAKGLVWLADQPYAPGQSWGYFAGSTAHHREAEDVPTNFADERLGDVQYRFDVPNRKYSLLLGFFDDTSKAVGDRLFAITVLNQVLEKSFDLYKSSNGKRQRLTLTIKNIQVVNGFVTLHLSGIRGSPTLSTIELLPE